MARHRQDEVGQNLFQSVQAVAQVTLKRDTPPDRSMLESRTSACGFSP